MTDQINELNQMLNDAITAYNLAISLGTYSLAESALANAGRIIDLLKPLIAEACKTKGTSDGL
jgi:hypothetical protein